MTTTDLVVHGAWGDLVPPDHRVGGRLMEVAGERAIEKFAVIDDDVDLEEVQAIEWIDLIRGRLGTITPAQRRKLDYLGSVVSLTRYTRNDTLTSLVRPHADLIMTTWLIDGVELDVIAHEMAVVMVDVCRKVGEVQSTFDCALVVLREMERHRRSPVSPVWDIHDLSGIARYIASLAEGRLAVDSKGRFWWDGKAQTNPMIDSIIHAFLENRTIRDFEKNRVVTLDTRLVREVRETLARVVMMDDPLGRFIGERLELDPGTILPLEDLWVEWQRVGRGETREWLARGIAGWGSGKVSRVRIGGRGDRGWGLRGVRWRNIAVTP